MRIEITTHVPLRPLRGDQCPQASLRCKMQDRSPSPVLNQIQGREIHPSMALTIMASTARTFKVIRITAYILQFPLQYRHRATATKIRQKALNAPPTNYTLMFRTVWNSGQTSPDTPNQ